MNMQPVFDAIHKKIKDLIDFGGDFFYWSDYIDGNTSDNYIMYNTEHLKKKLKPKYKAFLDGAEDVYDYSINNLKYYPRAIYLPLLIDKPIDFLFYGFLSPRRKKITDKLTDLGYNVVIKKYIFGDMLQKFISKSKVVLSIGAWDNSNSDSVRIPLATEMGAYIISEKSDDVYDDYLMKFPNIQFAEYDKIIDVCKKKVKQ